MNVSLVVLLVASTLSTAPFETKVDGRYVANLAGGEVQRGTFSGVLNTGYALMAVSLSAGGRLTVVGALPSARNAHSGRPDGDSHPMRSGATVSANASVRDRGAVMDCSTSRTIRSPLVPRSSQPRDADP